MMPITFEPFLHSGRGLPKDSWEMGLGGATWMPLYSWDPSRDLARVDFLTLSSYFKSGDLSRNLVGVALT